MAELVVIGEMLVEMLATETDQSFRTPGRFAGPYPSGAPAIFADQAARLGLGTAMVGCVGHDDFGTAVIDRLVQDGVDVSSVRRAAGLATGVAFVTYRHDGSRDFIFHVQGAAAGALRSDDVASDLFADCRFYHVMGSSLFSADMATAIRAGLTHARAAGATVSFDPNIRPELLRASGASGLVDELVASARILMPSEADLAWLLPGRDFDIAAQALLADGAERIFLKRGKAGSIYYDRTQRIETPAFEVDEVDPTGAGDCAGATFLAGVAQGMPLPQVLTRANAAGALAVSRRGPMEGNSTPEDLDRFLKVARA